jgi:thioredoxin-related protein
MRAILGFLAFVIMTAPAFAAEMGDDGLYKPDWFSLTFKDVGEDLAAAREEGKRLVLIFEQRGCVYCRKMHEVVLADPQVRDYIKANYKVVQYNLFGDEEVTDLDGEVLTEKKAARKWGVVFTPTVVFLPEDVTESPAASAR